MDQQQVRRRARIAGLRARLATFAAGSAAALLAIGLALVALTALALALGALGATGVDPASHGLSLSSAAQDAAVAFYLVQLVGVSFFNGTAELRFAAVPGLLLVGFSILAAALLAARLARGPARRKMAAALSLPVPYALLAGLGALFIPLHLDVPGFGGGITVSPSPAEAFLLPLGWGLVFASVGGLIGVFGRHWRGEAWRRLGTWAVPLATSLRVLTVSLAAATAIALIAALSLAGWDLGSITGGGLTHLIKVLLAALIALPTMAAAVLVSGFAVPFNWQLDALSHGVGSISATGGALPSTDSAHGSGAPGVLALAPLLALAGVFVIGWLSARRSGKDVRLGFANVARAATLTTLAVWLLALIARVDAQAGGLLGFHLTPDGGALLWRVPLLTFLGCFAGGLASTLQQGRLARRHLAATLRETLRPAGWEWGPSRIGASIRVRQGLTWRAALGASFAAVPVALVVMGASGTVTSAAPPEVSVAPIEHAAEQQLERASSDEESVEVSVDPETRAVSTASVDTPLHALGIAAGKSRSVKAEDVLHHYGELLGVSNVASELGNPRAVTNRSGTTQVAFPQMADGLPVFGGAVGVRLSDKGETLSFLTGSVIPDVMVADDEAKLSSAQAVAVAEKALPSGEPAASAKLEVYAGLPPYTSGPNARLAWFVWLISEGQHASNEYVVDAVTGQILDTIPKASEALDREIYNAHETAEIPGELVRAEGEPATGDEDSDDAYENTGTVYEFYEQLTESDSYDKHGAPLISTVHFTQASGAAFENAYWNGRQMVFGTSFPRAVDIVGHELTHAYVEHTSNLVGSGQSGALNESIADIMGTAIETWKTGEVNWEMGNALPEGLGPFRSLSEPGKYHELAGAGDSSPDPSSLAEWVETCLDNLGIHINSTITSHAFYLAASNLSVNVGLEPQEAALEASIVFYQGFSEFLMGNPTASLEDARQATLVAAEEDFGKGTPKYNAFANGFTSVGLNGSAQPSFANCAEQFECSFARALQTQHSVSGSTAASMLTTLYKARGELAQPSAAGRHFLPLYEGHMGRISELVTDDPTLDEIAVNGLGELTPALEALMEGEGERYELSPELMERIEAALRRLAQDDRIFEGPGAGELADLIEEELEWMGLPSYGGMNFKSGFQRLNNEVEAQMLTEETGVIMDPNCTGRPYPNNFHVNGFSVDTPGHRIPGQVSPVEADGVICGTELEATGGTSGCTGSGTLNTQVTATLPPGDKVNSSKNLASGSWVGETVGNALLCAGNETRKMYGQAGLLSLKEWTAEQCPTTALACYEGRSTFSNSEGSETGHGYAWVSESGGKLALTLQPVSLKTRNGYTVKVGYGQFEVKLCGRAGSSATQECGGPSATWIHANGTASEGGCPGGNGRFEMDAENALGEETAPASSCVFWQSGAHMQALGAPNSLNAVSCVPGTTSCVATDSKGNAFYSTNVSTGSASTWTSWTGPGVSPSEDVECPSTTLCLLAAGEVSGGGGNVYRTSSFGGSWLTSFKPTNGVGAISCPSSAFCVTAQEGGGFIRYSTNPSGIIWSAVSIGTGAIKDVSCLSSSFCAAVDGSGNVHVATTEKGVKEAAGWKASNIDGTTALRAIACSSTSSCVAVDGSGEVLELAVEASGAATVSRKAVPGAAKLVEVTCNGSNCVAVDDVGGIFASTDSGATWKQRFDSTSDLTSVSCASATLCASVDTSGELVAFDPGE